MNEVVANYDHLQSLKFRPTLPYAFTEQVIGQLSSVVHTEIVMREKAYRCERKGLLHNYTAS